jgi:hypothetical protein
MTSRSFAPALALLAGCGTYSHIRPADNLPSGTFEASFGMAANSLGEVLPVGAAALGLTDWLELEGQYEIYSGFAELRAGLLGSERNGFALALGVGGGLASVYTDGWAGGAAAIGDLTLGRRFGRVDLYVADRFFYLPKDRYTINSIRGGVRVSFDWFHIGAEGGATLHQGLLWLGEGTLYVGIHF